MLYLYIILGAVFIILVLIILLIVLIKLRKKKEALIRVNDDRKRLNELDKRVLNSTNQSKNTGTHANTPYEAKYNSSSKQEKNQYLMQIEELTGVSSQKYVFNMTESVTIGNKSDNSLVIRGQDIDELKLQFSFFIDEPKVSYLENKGKSESILVTHKGSCAQLTCGKWIKVYSGDTIVIGTEKLNIKYIKV